MPAAASASSPATTIELVLRNQSSCALSFTPQITSITPAGNGTATLHAGPVPVPVPAAGSDASVTVSMAPAAGLPVTVTLELDGSIGGTAFSLVQAFGVNGDSVVPVGYALPATWPLSAAQPPALSGTLQGGAYQLILTIAADFALLPENRFSVQGTRIFRNGQPFFARGVNYSPTPVGGATFLPGVGDWFVPPWWTGAGGDLGSRDIPLLKAAGANAVRTYFSWYWYKNSDLDYLQGITQSTPMSVYTPAQYPYTVSFDHTPFLDACYANGIYVVLGIAVEGGNCFNYAVASVSSAYQNFYLQTAQKLATLYGKHPAVLGFCMGNEQNNAVVNTDSRTWLYYQSMYQAIKAAAPDKLALIAFQDDQTLYNGSVTVTDQAGQQPPTAFNGMPIESVIGQVVDVWGLNIYAGIDGDFPIYQANVVEANQGADARPLFVTEWGTPAGQNTPAGMPGPTVGNAKAQELDAAGLAAGAATIGSAVAMMQNYLAFVAGAFYFEFTDEWWKNASFDPKHVDKAKSPLDPATQMYRTDAQGKVAMLGGGSVYPAYPFTHDGGQAPAWPEESWGLYGIAVAEGRAPYAPSPTEPDILSPRTPYVQALHAAYEKIGAAYEAAQAIAVMEGGVVLQVLINSPGSGYLSAPLVTIGAPGNGGMTAQAVATVAHGAVTAVTVTSQGSGYQFGPQVSFTPPGS